MGANWAPTGTNTALSSIADVLREAKSQLSGPTARLDAELLLAYQIGVSRETLLLRSGERIAPLAATSAARPFDPAAFAALVARRAAHEPIAYITGIRHFWSLTLAVTPAVLIPRPDSETLIEAALAHAPAARRVLDLGTGSGALLLAALADRPNAWGLGTDTSAAALAVAAANAVATGLGGRACFVRADWAAPLAGGWDLILSNPPYVADGAALPPDVADFEPAAALFAGADGLDAYRALLPEMPRLLAPGGVAILETGWDQAQIITAMARESGLAGRVVVDLGSRDRAVVLVRA